MTKKPELIVKLFAGDTLVDQSTDVGLWQRVLSEIREVTPPGRPLASRDPAGSTNEKEASAEAATRRASNDPLSAFAKDLGISVDDVVGGLEPQTKAPFISLDGRSWEALKKNTPARGPGGVPAAVLAATALALWQKHARTEDVTLDHVRATLGTIELEDKNLSRSIDNCDWLQMKGNRVVVHPTQMSGGVRLLVAYCMRQPPSAEK
jgi:hypothetical protein